MRKNIIIILFLVVNIASAFGNEQLRKAEEAYDKKKYKEAIANYQALVDQGFKSPQLFFNLGNSYYRDNQLGKAIYYYELSRKLAPNDEDVRINLGIASSKTVDRIDSRENFFINAVKTGLLTSFSTTVWGWMSVAFMFLGTLFLFTFFQSSRIVVKRLSLGLSAIFILLFILVYVLGYSALNARNENKFAIILAREIRVMNEPTAMAKSKFSLHEGTKIRIVENNGDWVLIKLDNGNEGWVKESEIGII